MTVDGRSPYQLFPAGFGSLQYVQLRRNYSRVLISFRRYAAVDTVNPQSKKRTGYRNIFTHGGLVRVLLGQIERFNRQGELTRSS